MYVLYLLVLFLVLALCVLLGRMLCSCDCKETVALMRWKRRASTPNADKAQRSSIDFLSPPQPSDGAITIHRTNGDGADAVNSSAPRVEAQGKSRSGFRPDNVANPTLKADDFATSCLPTLSGVETEAAVIGVIGTSTALRGLAPLKRPVPGFMPRGALGTGPTSPPTPGHEPLVDEADAWEDSDGLPLRGRTQVFHMDASSVSRGEMEATPREPTMPGTIPEAAGEAWEDMDGLPLRGRTQVIRGGQSLLHDTETDLQFAAVATQAPKMAAVTELAEPNFESFDEFDFMAHRLKEMFADPGESTGDLRGVPLRQQSTTSTFSVATIGCGSGYVDVMPPSRGQSNSDASVDFVPRQPSLNRRYVDVSQPPSRGQSKTSDASVDVVPRQLPSSRRYLDVSQPPSRGQSKASDASVDVASRQLSWGVVGSTVEPVALRPASHKRNLAFGVRDSLMEDEPC